MNKNKDKKILQTTKDVNEKILINFKKYLIVKQENKKENNTEDEKKIICSFLKSITSFKLITLAPKSAGIDNKKDIFVASYLLKFKNLAAVIVIPALLTPGIKAKT